MSTWEDLIVKKEQWKDKTIEYKRAYTRLMYQNQNLTEALAAIIKCMEEGYELENHFKKLASTAIQDPSRPRSHHITLNWKCWEQFQNIEKEIDDTIDKMTRGVNTGLTLNQVKDMKLKYVNTNNPYLVSIVS